MTQQSQKSSKSSTKKYLVYAIMVTAFVGCLWLIFAPSATDKEAEQQGLGFNVDIPDPRNAGIVDDKKTAYEQEQLRLRQERQQNSLRDYSYMLEQQNETDEERATREERQLAMAPKPPEYYENPEWFETTGNAFGSSASAHAELTGSLGNFFEEPEVDPEKEEMAAEIERLNAVLSEQQAEQMTLEDQFALMERSYQLAAKYTGEGVATSASEPVHVTPSREVNIAPVTQVNQSVVTLLAAPISDAEYVRQFSQERNRGFITAGKQGRVDSKNTIAAVIHSDQTLIDGQTVRLRTTEPMQVGTLSIPRGTIITGTGYLAGERLEIEITAVEHSGTIVTVEMSVCDSDGQRGVHVPGSMELEAFKEIVGNMGQSLGSTINLNQQSAGEQLLTDLGRGVIQGTSQYISKKARQVKVHLKAGHQVLLLPKTE